MTFQIQSETRDERGRSDNRRLRRLGKVPAIIYGGGKDARSITVDHNALLRQMSQAAFFTSILTVKIGEEAHAVVVKEVQRHPAKPLIMHLDFQRIVEDEELTLFVPLRFIGEEVAKGVKEQGGVFERLATDIEVSCLPRDLPDVIDVDVTHMELGEMLHFSDLKLPQGVTVIALTHNQDHPVVTLVQPRREEVDTEDGAEAPAPAAGEGKAAE